MVAIFIGLFAFKAIFAGMSSQIVLALVSTWWFALYVGRFSSPNWVSVLVSVLAISAVFSVLMLAGFQGALAIKPTNDVAGLAGVAISNGILFSTPLVVNMLVEKLAGMFGGLNTS